METASSQSLSRLWRLALVGAATAFAWMVLALVLGLGSGQAHADDDDGLLGAVTSVVDKTASAVTDTVSTVTGDVAKTVDTVVAVAPVPAREPVRDAVKGVGAAVTTVTEPVARTVSNGTVGAVTEPVADAITTVPVVGDLVAATGLDDVLADLGETADRTVVDVIDAVTGAATELSPPATPAPELPWLPGAPMIPVGGPPLPALDVVLPATPTVATAWGAASALSALVAANEHRSAAPATVLPASVTSLDLRGPLAPAGGLCPPSALSSGPGGAGSGAWALVALGPLVAHRAWVRRAGPEDDHAPPAPAGSTDVSPD